MAHVAWTRLLDHAAGRPAPGVEDHLAACGACAARADEARRLVAAGRGAVQLRAPSRRALRRALRVFRDQARGTARGSVLRLVLDSLLRPAPALRVAGGATRFLRFEGDETTVELQLTKAPRGFELRGQVTPVDHAAEVVADLGTAVRKARVGADGTFVFRALPAQRFSLRVGGSLIRDLVP